MNNPSSLQVGDRVAIGVAVVCAVHCLAAPLLAFSYLGPLIASEQVEDALLAVSLTTSGGIVLANCLTRRARRASFAALLTGAGVLLAVRFDIWTPAGEQASVLAGAALIVTAHVLNLLGCRCEANAASCVATE